MSGYENKCAAAFALGAALSAADWHVYGLSCGHADGMTDSFGTGSWSGYAEHPNAPGLRVVSSSATSRRTITEPVVEETPCARCKGAGVDPELSAAGWTLGKARLDPQAYHAAAYAVRHALTGSQAISFLRNVVSPMHFRDDGSPRCEGCSGHGCTRRVTGHRTIAQWPTFATHATNDRQVFAWIERDRAGAVTPEVLATMRNARTIALATDRYGDGSISSDRGERSDNAAAHLARCLDQCQRAAGIVPPERAPDPVAASVVGAREGITVSHGRRPGVVEIRFAEKPEAAVRSVLKGCGFRWAPSEGCWYGPAARLSAEWLAQHGARLPTNEGEAVRDPGEDDADRWAEAQGGAL